MTLPAFAGDTAWIVAIFVVAGLIKGVIGLGLPTIAMALLALRLTPADAAALLVLPALLTNVWQMRPFGGLAALWRDTRPLQLGAIAGTLLAGLWLGAPTGTWASLLLGVVLMLYALLGIVGWQWRTTRRTGVPAGLLTGAVTATTGVFVLPAVPWLQAQELSRDRLVQAMGLSFTVSTLALSLNLVMAGTLRTSDLAASAGLVLPALAGMALGGALRRRLPETVFRRCFQLGLLALGAGLVLRALLA